MMTDNEKYLAERKWKRQIQDAYEKLKDKENSSSDEKCTYAPYVVSTSSNGIAKKQVLRSFHNITCNDSLDCEALEPFNSIGNKKKKSQKHTRSKLLSNNGIGNCDCGL